MKISSRTSVEEPKKRKHIRHRIKSFLRLNTDRQRPVLSFLNFKFHLRKFPLLFKLNMCNLYLRYKKISLVEWYSLKVKDTVLSRWRHFRINFPFFQISNSAALNCVIVNSLFEQATFFQKLTINYLFTPTFFFSPKN